MRLASLTVDLVSVSVHHLSRVVAILALAFAVIRASHCHFRGKRRAGTAQSPEATEAQKRAATSE